ncbi:MAG: lipid A deacylase LpxR family protein [Pseudomonadota bacterium]
MHWRVVVGLLFLCLTPVVHAGMVDDFIEDYREANRNSDTAYRLDLENDLFFKTDNNYTDGIRFTRKLISRSTYVRTKEGKSWLPGYDLEPYIGSPQAGETYYKKTFNIHLGQNMYTPDNISKPPGPLGPADRPYAAWLYFGVYREVYSSEEKYWKYGVDIGCLGPCAQGERTQKFIHQYISNSPQPMGWDGQVRNEWGAIFRFEYVAHVLHYGDTLDLIPRVRVAFGNIEDAVGLEATLRWGRFNSLYDSHGADTQTIESVAQAAGEARSDVAAPLWENPAQRSEFYFFARGKANAVLYNATLQGGMINHSSPYTVNNRPEVFEGELGVVYNDRRGCPLFDAFFPGMKCSVTTSFVRRSSEVPGQALSPYKVHKFGRLQIGFEFD